MVLGAWRLEAIGRLASGAAHDFNNLLAVIDNCAVMVQEDLAESSPSRRDVEMTLEATDRAGALCRQLLSFARRQIIHPQPTRLNEVIDAISGLLSRMIGEHIQLQLELDSKAGFVLVDPSQIDQVLANLVVNARDAMPQGGVLLVSTENVALDEPRKTDEGEVPAGEYVELSVSDTGDGMTAEVRSRIFEPFYANRGSGGSGLGLATAYGAVRQNRGHIAVETAPDQGTLFRILLPRIEPPKKNVCANSGDRSGSSSHRATPRTRSTKGVSSTEKSTSSPSRFLKDSYSGPCAARSTGRVPPRAAPSRMISKIVATSAAVLLLACAPEEPPGVDESSGAEAPPGEELPSSCQPGTGATGAPQSIAEVVDLVNSLPRPVTLECFLESLQRPLRMEAAVSTVSAQLSLGSRSPRIFLFSGPLILTLAPEGLGAHLLEMGELVDDLRSLKAEIEFPVEDELTQEAPYETVLFTEDRLTTCALCHAEEVEVPGTPKRFTSLALRPSTGALVNLEWLEMEYAICDHEAEPERCSFFEALFGPGQVEHQSFPSEFGSFGI